MYIIVYQCSFTCYHLAQITLQSHCHCHHWLTVFFGLRIFFAMRWPVELRKRSMTAYCMLLITKKSALHSFSHADQPYHWNGHTIFTIANIFQKVGKYLRQLNKMQIIPLTSLSNVTCSVWRSFLCFQIIRINLSQMLPLQCLSRRRMPCCLTSAPVNTYTAFCSNVLSTKYLVQFIILSI